MSPKWNVIIQQGGSQLRAILSAHWLFGLIWRHFGLSWLWSLHGAAGIYKMKSRHSTKHPIMYRAAPITDNYLIPNVNKAGFEKSQVSIIKRKVFVELKKRDFVLILIPE